MRTPKTLPLLAATLGAALFVVPATLAQDDSGNFARGAAEAQADLDKALEELAQLRESIAAEKLPLTKKLHEREDKLVDLRAEADRLNRRLDAANLDLTNLQARLKAREDERGYLSNLLDEYIRNFESRVHVAELQRYRDLVRRAHTAPENPDLPPSAVYAAQAAVVEASLDRLLDNAGGSRFQGNAVDPDGRIRKAEFALVGPVALYRAEDGSSAGLAEQRLGSLEANMVPFQDPVLVADATKVVQTGQGTMPFDPTLGNATKVEATEETLVEQIEKGGPVMIPILLLAGAALVVAFLKWIQLARVRSPSTKAVAAMLEALRRREHAATSKAAQALPGPTGEMVRAGVEHIAEPKELVEEVMFERMLETRLRLQAYLPFIAMAASAAPLLGLLGTVTGMINTFKLITVFGTGDAKTLSSGISEALITTEFGLIVAIPSLLLYAYLSRRARRMIDGMEKTAVSFLNRLGGTPGPREAAAIEAELATDLTPEQRAYLRRNESTL